MSKKITLFLLILLLFGQSYLMTENAVIYLISTPRSLSTAFLK